MKIQNITCALQTLCNGTLIYFCYMSIYNDMAPLFEKVWRLFRLLKMWSFVLVIKMERYEQEDIFALYTGKLVFYRVLLLY